MVFRWIGRLFNGPNKIEGIEEQVGIGGQVKISQKNGSEVFGNVTFVRPDKKEITIVSGNGTVSIVPEDSIESFSYNPLSQQERTGGGVTAEPTESVAPVTQPEQTQSQPATTPTQYVAPVTQPEQTQSQPATTPTQYVAPVTQPEQTQSQPAATERVSATPKPEQPQEQPTPERTEPSSQQKERNDQSLLRVIKIEGRFDSKLENAKLELKEPDFRFPSSELHERLRKNWDRIKNRYDHARKNNELSSRHGRIQPLLHELTDLAKDFPDSPSLKRHLAYLHYLSNNFKGATKYYKDAAMSSQAAEDWFNVAVVALQESGQEAGKEELAAYGLKQFFWQESLAGEAEAWYVYVRLLKKFTNYPALRELCRAEREFSEGDLELLLETGIYLLKAAGEEPQAIQVARQWNEGQPLQSLAQETFESLAQKTTESYLRYSNYESQLSKEVRKIQEEIQDREGKLIRGSLYKYLKPQKYGFIVDDENRQYFFHSIDVIDDELIEALNQFTSSLEENITVVFKAKRVPEGLKALDIAIDRRLGWNEEPEREGGRETRVADSQQIKGDISTYFKEKNYGFLRDRRGSDYFFHKTGIIDENLQNRLEKVNVSASPIAVLFEMGWGKEGPIALAIVEYRDTDDVFQLANEYADEGDYGKAIQQIKRVLEMEPNYSQAQELHEKWRKYASETTLPKGSNPYAKAKRAQELDRDYEEAARLYRQAIARQDNLESAIKDFAKLLTDRLNRTDEAIKVLEENRQKVRDRNSLENLLVNIYKRAGQYEKAIALLEIKRQAADNPGKKAKIFWEMANCYLYLENFEKAKEIFNKLLKIKPDNIAAKRNLAICYSRMGRYEEAEKELNEILDSSNDSKSAEILAAIVEAKQTGQGTQLIEIVTQTILSELDTGELSGFAQFFLERCGFQGVDPERVPIEEDRERRKYVGSERDANQDIERLQGFAKDQGTSRPGDRSNYHLSAARILLDIGEDRDYSKYLYRSFTSRGDAAVKENRPLDTAREWYSEALSIYDRVPGGRDEQDAANALVRFLFSTLGRDFISTTPNARLSIDEAVETAITHPYAQQDKAFDAIAYLVWRSRYAANRILDRIHRKQTLQALAIKYLNNRGIEAPKWTKNIDEFVELWDELRRQQSEAARSLANELRFLTRVSLTTASLENGIGRAMKVLENRLLLDLDGQRVQKLRETLATALDLSREKSFEERERLCIQIENRCQDLFKEIEDNPTKLSIEEIYPVVEALQKRAHEELTQLYETAKPQVSLRLAVDSYVPDKQRQIEVQIAIANEAGRSPAESLELLVQKEDNYFDALDSEIKLDESLRGGAQKIAYVRLSLTEEALQSETFSLTLSARYRTRSQDVEQTDPYNFGIKLYSEEDFEQIANPYAAYAEGGIVGKPEMFFGRGELIQTIARSIRESRSQSKCAIVFGQKRAGKSSILHHLKVELEADKDLMILDVGNIGAILDENSEVPLLYQILWGILKELGYAIEDRIDEGYSDLNLQWPTDMDFYDHPSPLTLFQDLLDRFQRAASKREDWRNLRIVVSIDEFSYIYQQIVAGRIAPEFMKNWKAILQRNYFNVVLVGQDVMPKFKQRFANEFGTSQDERVTYLREEDAKKLIDEPIRIGGREGKTRYREQAIARILELTAGSPFYIQIICNRLVEDMNRRRVSLVTEADVEQVKNDLIRGVNPLGLDKFENLVNSGDTSAEAISDEDALAVLKAIALNSRTGLCLRSSIACQTDTPIDEILEDLAQREVIDRERQEYYEIKVGLFKEWLIAKG
ncbi:MAG: tetratricopeptide repeat protein [Oscillatoria sp. SIO1A7]|nr:tetratricopeptide repeat protein [Oscillatoria sp. SIO1A7]